MNKPSFLTLDFSYAKVAGHHHALNQLISRSAAAQGFAHKILSSRYIDRGLLQPGVIPTFRCGVYLPVGTKIELLEKHRKIVRTTLVDLALSGIQIWGRHANIIIHTATASHLIAVIRFLKFFRFRGRINFFLMFPPDFEVPEDLVQQQADLYVEAYRLALSSGLDIRFWCENLNLSQIYRSIGLESAQFASLPSDMPSIPTRAAPQKNDPYTVLFIGDPRPDKGFKMVVDALPLIGSDEGSVKIRLQLTSLSDSLLGYIEPYMARGLVELQVHRFIENERYFEEIYGADLCALPYDPKEYLIKNSNIVSESLGCGTPVIVPPGQNSLTAYCQQFGPHAYIEMDAYTSEGFARAIQTAMTNQQALSDAAANAMSTVRRLRDPVDFISRMSRN